MSPLQIHQPYRWPATTQLRRQPGPKLRYLGSINGLLVGAVTEQGDPELNGDAAEGRDLVGAGSPGVQAALRGVVQLLQGEEAKALDECAFHLQDRQTWMCVPASVLLRDTKPHQ